MAGGGSDVDCGVSAVIEEHARPNFRALSEIISARLPSAAVGVDRHGRVVLTNPAAKRFFGGDQNELSGRSLATLLDLDAQATDDLDAAISGRRRALTVQRAGSAGEPVSLTIMPCRRAHDGGGALVLIDEELDAESEEQSTQRLAALGRLSAGVAHEIRNPLSGIGTNAQVLRRRIEDSDPRTRFVDFILEEVQRLDKIIEDMLRFARPPEPRMVPHDLTHTIDRVLMLADGQITAAGVEVRVDLAPDAPKVFVDPDQVQQVLLNLVLNGVQAMREPGTMTIALRRGEPSAPTSVLGTTPSAERFVAVEVRDTGVGIAASDLPKLFEPFFTTRPSGTGLGLSTSQVLIRQHGGAMHIDSKLGRGTSVTVLLPVEKRRAATGS